MINLAYQVFNKAKKVFVISCLGKNRFKHYTSVGRLVLLVLKMSVYKTSKKLVSTLRSSYHSILTIELTYIIQMHIKCLA
jgi:hypothetical protein